MAMRIFSFSVIIIIILSMLTACTKGEKPLTAAELLDLGEKYLLEMNYEQAAVHFLKVIEVEPMNPRGYTGTAEAYLALGEGQKAVDALQKGLEALPENMTIQGLLLEILRSSSSTEQEAVSVSGSEIDLLAEKLISIYESNGHENILDEIRSSGFVTIVSSALNESANEPVIYVASENIGCGFYLVDDKIFVYIGEYAGLSRSGRGIWLHANISDKGYYMFIGNWSDDMPNGEGQVASIRDESAIEKQEGYTYSLKSTITGTFHNGLVDGAINEQWLMDDGHTHNWNLTAVNGYYSVVGSVERSDSSIGFCTECNADLNNDSIDGVKGFME